MGELLVDVEELRLENAFWREFIEGCAVDGDVLEFEWKGVVFEDFVDRVFGSSSDLVGELEGDEPIDDDSDRHGPGDDGGEVVLVEAGFVFEPALHLVGAEARIERGELLEHRLGTEVNGDHFWNKEISSCITLTREVDGEVDGN